MSASATTGAPPTDARGACVPGAERFLPRPGAVCANPAERGTGRPDAPDTPKPERGEPHMAAAAPRAAAAWRARGARGAGASGSKPGCVPAAGKFLRSMGAPSARRARRSGARPRESFTKKGAPGGGADVAGRTLPATLRCALPAPQGMKNAVRERTPRAAGAIATGAPAICAWTARRRFMEHRGAPLAHCGRISLRASTRGCPSIRHATPWLNSPRAPSTAPSTPGRRWRCASPSKGSPERKSRSLRIAR